MKELGIKGVKFQSRFQQFYPDEERMFPIYEELIKAGLIILFHAGHDIRPASVIHATPRRLAKVLDVMRSEIDNYNYRVQMEDDDANPARIIAAHLGGYKMWDQVEEYLLGRDLYLDASYVFGHLDFERANRMIISHGIDKVLFGSDFPFSDQKKDIQAVMQLGITQEEKEKILSSNVSRLLNFKDCVDRKNRR
jgi:predicted TIM-barrel fold metal-dependent hydrolase